MVYYNENDPAAVHCLRALIADGVIAFGEVDDRSIIEVKANDLQGYKQCHFFAGGGLWSAALRQAGWADDRPVWTASCPCQPFSAAGKHKGTDDPRHLWPHLYRLVGEARPDIVMGEQVSGKAGYGWLDGVCDDLKAEGYTSGAADIAACAIDAPHQRSRLWWYGLLENTGNTQQGRRRSHVARGDREAGGEGIFGHDSRSDGYGSTPDTVGIKQAKGSEIQSSGEQRQLGPDAQIYAKQMEHAESKRRGKGRAESIVRVRRSAPTGTDAPSYWGNHWVECYDGKARRTEPGKFIRSII